MVSVPISVMEARPADKSLGFVSFVPAETGVVLETFSRSHDLQRVTATE